MGDFWKPTAELFGSLIEKPKMTQKLLSKPPFKYLFDIITETTKKTGVANGLFTGPELSAEHYNDKDKKIAYLQKVIQLVELMGGAPVAAKPQKIVAGLEPEATNDLLQRLHACATSGKSPEPYVNKILGKAEPEPEKKEFKKPERPPSAARIKKPAEPQRKPPKEEEEEAPPPPAVEERKPEEKSAKMGRLGGGQKYSENVEKIRAEAEEEEARGQKEAAAAEEKDAGGKGKNLLGKLGGKKRKEQSEKLISTGGDLTEKELELVQNMIQSICQNTAPLGKSIEFINDDIDAMNKELTAWRKQYNASKAKTQNELKTTQDTLMPVYDKIREVEEQILDQKAKIQTTKAQILKNDSTIRDLLMSVVTTK